MPMFEYICSACNNKFEELVSSSSSKAVNCPECKSDKVDKQLSTFSASVSSSTPSAPCGNPSACDSGFS